MTRTRAAAIPVAPPDARRQALQCRANPNAGLDYLVTIEDGAGGSGWTVTLRYVPDRLLLDIASVRGYFALLGALECAGPEPLALTILEDINNEAVPRWVQVSCTAAGAPGHRVLVEDRQPSWDNPDLLARLPAA